MLSFDHVTFFAPSASRSKPFLNTEVAKDSFKGSRRQLSPRLEGLWRTCSLVPLASPNHRWMPTPVRVRPSSQAWLSSLWEVGVCGIRPQTIRVWTALPKPGHFTQVRLLAVRTGLDPVCWQPGRAEPHQQHTDILAKTSEATLQSPAPAPPRAGTGVSATAGRHLESVLVPASSAFSQPRSTAKTVSLMPPSEARRCHSLYR